MRADFGKPLHTKCGGMGASRHAIEEPIPLERDRSHGGSAWVANPPAEDDIAWKRVRKHAERLGFDFSRVEIEPRMYQPGRRRFTCTRV